MSKRNFYQFDHDARKDKGPPVPPNDAELALSTIGQHSKRKVAYFYQEEASAFHYGEGHPMKPARLALTHNLVFGYGLHEKMNCFRSRSATDEEIAHYHSSDYIEFLQRVTPDNRHLWSQWMTRFNLGVDDCPIFDGVYDFCLMYAGASLDAARKLSAGTSDIAVNWSGGLHHAKKWEASGFCYVNDIVLSILELLRVHPRIVYVDIDVHHGDGVQEAFYRSNRVMTVSFHRYDGSFFPGTGNIDEKGVGVGKNYAINVPLTESVDDDSYAYIFRNVMNDVMESFRPTAIVLQCGADSLAKDRLGCFNLSIRGHGECVKFMKNFNIPMLVLGGGGYTIRNVARAWTYETSVLVDQVLDNDLPNNAYMSHFGPEYVLHTPIKDVSAENTNPRQKLDYIREKIREYLRGVEHAPSVQMQEIPSGLEKLHENGDWMADKNADMYADFREDIGLFSDTRNEKELNTADDREHYQGEFDQDRDWPDEEDVDVSL
ncbi:hypothetical protein PhCBS80983_g00370 [Powellomyces hirtus]|uniref:Histone deacetylase n=1 Tax=Powellomyces hirtus TaxID=109895 RepID=A0A507EGR0_9FUNG|nr:hypothetical protein PhCBS80983_g00370 [Powellomyces hirtus]